MTGSYAIGLDLGDGESALAWVDVDQRDEAPRLYHRSPDEINVVTAIARSPGGEHLLGDAALRDPEARQVRINFKTRPMRSSGAGIVKPLDAVEFAQLFLIEFSERHEDIAKDCTVYVGHPAGWGDWAHLYREQLQNVLHPLKVEVVAESQAAFLYVSESPAIGRDVRPVLVVDVGSSTTDFTLIRSQQSQAENLSYGDGLGCRMIDEALCDAVIKDINDSSSQDRLSRPSNRSLMLWMCRRRKEAYYAGVEPEPPHADTGELKWLIDTCWDNLEAMDVPAIVNRMWKPKLRRELMKVHKHLDGTSPRLILTTGGGSRMPFVADLCQRIFPGADVDPITEPSLAVARGLASYGRWRHRVAMFRREVSRIAQSDLINDLVRNEASAFAQRLYMTHNRYFLPAVLEPAFKQIEDGVDPSELIFDPERVSGLLTTWLDSEAGASARAELFGPLETAIDQKLSSDVREACMKSGLPPDALETHLRMPTAIMLRPRGWLLRASESYGKAVGSKFSNLYADWYKSPAMRGYIRGVARATKAMTESSVGRWLANKYEIDQSDLTELTEIIRTEIRDRLLERVGAIEGLLAQR